MPVGVRSHIFNALLNAWGFILHLAPYLIIGILIAALINTFASRRKLARLLEVRRWWVLPAASLIGIVSPACTYGTVPIFMELIKRGAPMAPAATFLVASALVNPQMFLLTLGALGMPVALVQAGASLVFAIMIGVLVARATASGIDLESSELKASRLAENLSSHSIEDTARIGDHGLSKAGIQSSDSCSVPSARKHLPWPQRLLLNTLDLTEFVGFYFVIGTILAALVAEFVPAGIIIAAVGQGKWWAVPFAAVVSIPTYVCGGGIIPFIAQARSMGMASGAVLAFLIAGPATRITALTALAVLFRKRAVLAYLALLLVFSTFLGTVLGQFIQGNPQPTF